MKTTTLFFIVLLIEIFGSITYNYTIVWVTKPLLVPILMFLAYQNGIRDKLLYFALFFGFLGDVFLMFKGSQFFIFGLSAFLIGHIFYILLFKPQTKFKFMILVTFGLFVAAFLVFIYPSLPTEMVIPVVIYSLVITLMGIMAGSRKDNNQSSYVMILIGAALFIISDALIAINKFHTIIPKDALYVMSTYGLAQLLIVKGWIKQKGSP